MLGLLIFLCIILVLILINKNTKSSPEGMGCIQQGCLMVFAFLAVAMWASNQQDKRAAERMMEQRQRSRPAAPTQRVMFTSVTIADASNPSEHKASYDGSTSKIVVNCRVIGAAPGTVLTGKWFLLGSARQMLQQASVLASNSSQSAYFSATRPSDQRWPVGTYEVELWSNDTLCQTLTFWVNP